MAATEVNIEATATAEPKFGTVIRQVMYVAGETEEPSLETLALVEDIIKDQLSTANGRAVRRGDKFFSNDDLIFQFRHDSARVAHIQEMVSWKPTCERREKDHRNDVDSNPDAAIDVSKETLDAPSAAKASASNTEILPEQAGDEELFGESDDANLQKLREADERTKNMSREEYATWTKCRKASFTSRKLQLFRDWSGLGVIAEHKPRDDSIEILDFLACDMIHRLTGLALEVQKMELADKPVAESQLESSAASPADNTLPEARRPALDSRHIQQAFRAIQIVRCRPLFMRVPMPQTLKLM